ncbi:MAG TPA: TetR/AcrR family transcriptional regulator [Capillimicrobium sp.]
MPEPDRSPAWQAEPLPRGRHKLSADEVRDSQRERLLRAMLECVSESSYAEATVPALVRRARVSRTVFYRFFEDKEQCFLTLCDELGDELYADLVRTPARVEGGFSAVLDDGMERYLRWWSDRPAVARAWLLELPAAGSRAAEQRRRQLARFEQLLAALAALAREDGAARDDLDPMAPRLLALGITELVASEVRDGRVGELAALRPSLVALATRLLVT